MAVAAVVLAACGGGSTATTERGEVAVVRIETRGGFTANTSGRARLPRRAADPGALGPFVVPGSERRYEPATLAVLVRPSDAAGTAHTGDVWESAGAT